MIAKELLYEREAQLLADELYAIYGEDEKTILHVLSCVSDFEDDVKELLSFINDGNRDPDVIVSRSYEILQKRDPAA